MGGGGRNLNSVLIQIGGSGAGSPGTAHSRNGSTIYGFTHLFNPVFPQFCFPGRFSAHPNQIRAPSLRFFLAQGWETTTLNSLGYKEGSFPEAERAAREVLALPTFPELREDEQQTVVSAIVEFLS